MSLREKGVTDRRKRTKKEGETRTCPSGLILMRCRAIPFRAEAAQSGLRTEFASTFAFQGSRTEAAARGGRCTA